MLEEIRRFNRYYARVLGIFNKSYLDSGRSAAAVRILGEMERCPGITATEISALLDLDKSYLSRILSGFEKEGHLTRRQSPENWRAQELYLTASGLQLATELDRRADARIEGQLKGLSPEDTGQLLSAMHTIQTLLSPVILPEMEKALL